MFPRGALRRRVVDNTYCVAQKMSWASKRKTSRVEDIAYCLLGLFRVNMPLLYEEGSQAIRRLQGEILTRSSNDESIFAWRRTTDDRQLLAGSPDRFPLGTLVSGHSHILRNPSNIESGELQMDIYALVVRQATCDRV